MRNLNKVIKQDILDKHHQHIQVVANNMKNPNTQIEIIKPTLIHNLEKTVLKDNVKKINTEKYNKPSNLNKQSMFLI